VFFLFFFAVELFFPFGFSSPNSYSLLEWTGSLVAPLPPHRQHTGLVLLPKMDREARVCGMPDIFSFVWLCKQRDDWLGGWGR
jgi:hypothetical protein